MTGTSINRAGQKKIQRRQANPLPKVKSAKAPQQKKLKIVIYLVK